MQSKRLFGEPFMDNTEKMVIGVLALLALVGGGLYFLKVTTGIGPNAAAQAVKPV